MRADRAESLREENLPITKENLSKVFRRSSQRPSRIDRKQNGEFRKGLCLRMYPLSGFWCREHPNVPSFRLLVQRNIRMYPRSGFWYRRTSAKNTLRLLEFQTTLLRPTDRRKSFLSEALGSCCPSSCCRLIFLGCFSTKTLQPPTMDRVCARQGV